MSLLIEDYLTGNMSKLEKQKFEELKAKDQSLASETKFRKEVDQAIAEDNLQNFKDLLNRTHNKYFKVNA